MDKLSRNVENSISKTTPNVSQTAHFSAAAFDMKFAENEALNMDPVHQNKEKKEEVSVR
jgi:hypothetical protein